MRGLVIAMPVYRAYGDQAVIADAAATVDGVDSDVLGFVTAMVGGGDPELSRRFEQLTGPVMAKGVEDTAFYREHRLIALNEVGGDLDWWSVTPDAWHAWCLAASGGSMLATSTHDTKRSEDVRARVVLLSEIPAEWGAAVAAWEEAAGPWRTEPWPDPATAYLMWQTFVGAWPLTADRAVAYAQKATCEAKVHTSWTDPDPSYDEAVERWVRGVLGDPAITAGLDEFAGRLMEPGRVVSLAQTLCKLTAPGVPDIYQGCELWDLSLVDPDNRRPVDFGIRAASLRGGAADQPKLRLTAAALDLRRRHPASFAKGAAYTPLPTSDCHAVGFLRGTNVATVVPRLIMNGDAGTTVELPAGRWRDVITGAGTEGGRLPVDSLLSGFAVALLEKVG
jgi:(1->4)-alpha-D-glucan 1-alpha-D-glucosylmutase